MYRLREFWIREDGAVMVEMTIAMTLFLMLALGFVDFGHAFYQWNAASKAVQVGARTAAISNPVAPPVPTAAGTANSALVGVAMPSGSFSYSCTGSGSCTNTPEFSQPDFDHIFSRMVVFFPRLQPTNVRITYAATGLGYWSRPGGPVPTITVSLENVTFQFFFLSGLLGFNNITMPSMLSTVTGEDLKSVYP